MLAFKACLAILANLIVYYAFGNMLTCKKDKFRSPALTMACGFFLYYSLFALFALPIMLTFRPLSLLTRMWVIFTAVVIAASIILKGKSMAADFDGVLKAVRRHPVLTGIIVVAVLIQIVCIVCSYDFTLDAAYYVANVTTSLDTNMINVYDPFTGAWQDHFELRYAFATYSINDAVVCQLTGIPALVQTKTVMAATVALMVNITYLGVCRTFIKGNAGKLTIMMVAIVWINYTFVTIYTASNFLMSRTYEGKAIVGNLTLVLVFWMFVKLVEEETPHLYWLMLFIISFGSTTVTSSANMLIPAQFSVIFIPYIIRKKKWSMIWKYLVMMAPALVMLILYILYVKGYYAIYTYTRFD